MNTKVLGYAYEINPLDFCIVSFTEDEIKKNILKYSLQFKKEDAKKMIDDLKYIAKFTFNELGWEEDIREEGFFVIPDEIESHIVYALKQDNNGQTFIYSKVKLPHLEIYDNYLELSIKKCRYHSASNYSEKEKIKFEQQINKIFK